MREFLSPGNNMSSAQCMFVRACGLIMLNTVSCVRPQRSVFLNFFLISQTTDMLCLLKRTVSLKNEHKKYIVKLMGKK